MWHKLKKTSYPNILFRNMAWTYYNNNNWRVISSVQRYISQFHPLPACLLQDSHSPAFFPPSLSVSTKMRHLNIGADPTLLRLSNYERSLFVLLPTMKQRGEESSGVWGQSLFWRKNRPNRKHSFHLFVVVLYTCSVSYQLVSPFLAHATPT